jgi:hypothetical protein
VGNCHAAQSGRIALQAPYGDAEINAFQLADVY